MIDVKQAIRTAQSYFIEVYGSTGVPLNRLLLEGVEMSNDEKYWLITFGFDVERPVEIDAIAWNQAPRFDDLSKFERSYHTVWVRVEDGKPEKIKPALVP